MKKLALLALALIVPVTSIGALSSTVIAPGLPGQLVAIGCGLWLVMFPALWQKYVERQPLNLRQVNSGHGLGAGIALGAVVFGLILGGYWLVGRHWLDVTDIRARVAGMKMNIPLMVFGFGTFQTLVNSWIEEYVWRWFVYQRCAIVWGKGAAIWISAAFFTLHHVILLLAYCDNRWQVGVGTVAVFAAGVIWAYCFDRWRSLTPCYLSHLAADLALQIASWHVLMAGVDRG